MGLDNLSAVSQTVGTGHVAITKEEYERGGPVVEPVPERSDPEGDELVRKAKLRAMLQLIFAHRTEYESRVRANLREYGIEADSDWMVLLDHLQDEVENE